MVVQMHPDFPENSPTLPVLESHLFFSSLIDVVPYPPAPAHSGVSICFSHSHPGPFPVSLDPPSCFRILDLSLGQLDSGPVSLSQLLCSSLALGRSTSLVSTVLYVHRQEPQPCLSLGRECTALSTIVQGRAGKMGPMSCPEIQILHLLTKPQTTRLISHQLTSLPHPESTTLMGTSQAVINDISSHL